MDCRIVRGWIVVRRRRDPGKIRPLDLGLSGPGQGQDVDLDRLRFQKHLGAFLNGCSGGKNIIDEKDRFFAEGRTIEDRKGPANVLLPFRAGKLRLRLSGTDPPQVCEIERDGMSAAYGTGEEEGLIVSPLAQAPGMERNRNDKVIIQKGKFQIPGSGHQPTERFCQTGSSAILESGDHFGRQSFIKADGSRLSKIAFPPEAIGAEMILTRFGRKALSAARAARRGAGRSTTSSATCRT